MEGLPRFSIEQIDDQSYFTLEFRRRATLEDFQIIVEVSDNLRDWQSGPEVTTVLSVEPSGGEGERWIIRDNTPVEDRAFRFMRIRIQP